MSYFQFAKDLLAGETVAVGREYDPGDGVDAATRLLDHAARFTLPCVKPDLDHAAARWGLQISYRAVQALVYREIEANALRTALSEPCPQAPSPAVCYSVDLALQVLPDLVSLAGGISPEDPLVSSLLTLATQWPLSSVGVPAGKALDLKPFVQHPSLRRLYADRIVRQCAVDRLEDEEAREAVREALGGHAGLAPKLAALL